MDWIEEIPRILTERWIEGAIGLGLLVLGRWWGRRKARSDWRKKEFLHRINVSLNTCARDDQGRPVLQIRTLAEKDLKEVFLSEVVVEKVLKAAEHTTAEDPILPLEADDRWHVQNQVLNDLVEPFATGTLAADLGLPHRKERYLVALTREVAGNLRTHKIRAMVVRHELLESGVFEQAELQLESANHSTRVATLRRMREILQADPDRLRSVELCIRS